MIAQNLYFKSKNFKFCLFINKKIVNKILLFCKTSLNLETGGILIGYYNENHDCAIVTDVSGPPIDSKRGPATFIRGIKGLQSFLNKLWKAKNKFYIGEWHYHPFSNPEASSIDIKQLQDNSVNQSLMCPEPIMLIIGGDPENIWHPKVYIYSNKTSILSLNLMDENPDTIIFRRNT